MRTYIPNSKTNKLFLILSFLTLLGLKQSYAEIYYVSPSGSDSNSGLSLSSPFKTINNAVNNAWENGDIIYVMTGTYVESVSIWQSDITLTAYPDNTPIIDGKSDFPGEDWGALIAVGGDNNVVSGFELKNSNIDGQYLGGYGVEVLGHHNTISKMNVHHTWEQGIFVHGDYNVVEDSTIWQAAIQNSFNNGSTSGWGTGLSAARNHSSSALKPGITSYAILRRNTVYNNWGEGISCFEADHCTIEDNTIYDNWTANLYLSDATNSQVQRNLVYTSSAPAIPTRNGSHIGILLADEVATAPSSANNEIINNLIYNADFGAFSWSGVINSGLNNVLIANNTIIDGELSTGGDEDNIVNTNTQIKNNIILGKSSYIPSKSGITFSHNNWTVTPALAASPTDTGEDPQITRAGTTAPGTLTAAFFKLSANSPAIDAATPLQSVNTDIFMSTRNLSPDIGAHEFNEDTTEIIDSPPFSAPSNLTGTADTPTSINLSWNPPTDNINVAGYIIYRDSTEIGTSDATSYTDTSVTENTNYNYIVKAYDSVGSISNSSNTVTISTPEASYITSYYVTSKKATSAIIVWTTNIPSTGVVFYGTSATDLKYQISVNDLTTKHSVAMTGLTRRTKYYYKINIDSGSSEALSTTSSFRTRRR